MTAGFVRNLESIRGRIRAAASRAGRDPDLVTLVGVSKTVPPDRIREAIDAGLGDLGENRIQEAREKIPLLPGPVRWHLVGHLQGNKAKVAVEMFEVIHSVDSTGLLQRLDRLAGAAGRTLRALVQIDLADEPTKSGVEPDRLDAVLEAAARCSAVQVRGLMILPPYAEDPEKSRPWFRRLRELRDAATTRHSQLTLDQLSMGMSGDFEVAIEEGATIVRVGRALFGERPKR